EQLIAKALPKMIKASASSDLRDALADHKRETKAQIDRLDKIFHSLGVGPEKMKAYPIKAALEHGETLVDAKSDAAVRDAGLIAAAQKVEHYEIAGYGAVRTHASLLGYNEAAELLQATLNEEEEMNRRLTHLAKETVNLEAARAPFGHARTGTRVMSAPHTAENGSAGRLLIGMSIGAALAFFLGSTDWRKTMAGTRGGSRVLTS
ncbi:MAG: ferritin-like protein, partial [Bryobacterales bacterium]|nr:ferritin-like protein [Bryobacterales bacterium]